MEIVRQKMCTTRKKCNMKEMQHEESATQKGCSTKKCILKKVQYKKNMTSEKNSETQKQTFIGLLLGALCLPKPEK